MFQTLRYWRGHRALEPSCKPRPKSDLLDYDRAEGLLDRGQQEWTTASH